MFTFSGVVESTSQVLRGRDLEFFKEGDTRCSLWDATTIVLQLREAKNDQFSRFEPITCHLSGCSICPILTLKKHARLNPHWLNDPALPVLASRSKGTTREDVSSLLRVCSTALG